MDQDAGRRLAHFVWNLIGIESQPNDGGFNLDRDALDDALANFGLWFEARLHQHLSCDAHAA